MPAFVASIARVPLWLAATCTLLLGACRPAGVPSGAVGASSSPAAAPAVDAPAAVSQPTVESGARQITEARARLDAVRQAKPVGPRWDYHVHGCITDGNSPCKALDGPMRQRSPTAEEAAAIAAYSEYLQVCRSAGVTPDAEIVLEWSDLLLAIGDVRNFVTEELMTLGLEPGERGARAQLLFLHGLYAGAQNPTSDLRPTIMHLLDAALEKAIARPAEVSAQAEELRRIAPQLRLWAIRELRIYLCVPGPAGTKECIGSEELAKLLGPEHPDTPQFMLEGALARRTRGELELALQILGQELQSYPNHAVTQDARLALAETHEMVLDLASARDNYAQFLKHGRRDVRFPAAQRRWVTLAFVTRALPEAEIEALLDGDAEARELAVAVRFRSLADGDPDRALDAVLRYIQHFAQAGGDLRLALAHLLAARLSLRESCPTRGDNLCVELVPGQMLGRVLPRESRPLIRARQHLYSAESLLRAATPPAPRLGPPLDIEAAELVHARLELAFLKGDLGAESALAKRPPATFEATRTREWFTRRTSEVESMAATYDGALAAVGGELRDRYIARSSARKAQVYEADTTLLEAVALAVTARSAELGLVQSLRDLASARRRQAFEDYRRCLKAIATRGRDSDNLGDLCRAGVGRLTRRHDEAMEYTAIPIPG